MGYFSDILVRSNGDDILAGWFNDIRTALITTFPGVDVGSLAIANNQSSAANVTGLICDNTAYKYYRIKYDIHREDDDPTDLNEVGILTCFWNGTTWETVREVEFGNALGDGTEAGAETGLDYLQANTSTGQIEYKSSNFTGGSYEGLINWTILETRLAVS
jgi:hypothetical protein